MTFGKPLRDGWWVLGLGELKVIGRSPTVIAGDVVEGEMSLTWSKGNAEEVAQAAKVFKEYIEGGWLAIGEVGDRKMQIFAFDPELERITLSPINLGG